jgi:hypothetical protein
MVYQESLGKVISAADVAALPLCVVVGRNAGVISLSAGPSYSPAEDRRDHADIAVWLERTGYIQSGIFIPCCRLTGSSGSEWLEILESVASSMGSVGRCTKRYDTSYGFAFILHLGSVAAGDVLRWRLYA